MSHHHDPTSLGMILSILATAAIVTAAAQLRNTTWRWAARIGICVCAAAQAFYFAGYMLDRW